MISTQQKKKLKSLANNLDIKYLIGKNDLTDKVLDMLDKALTANELIKVSVLKNSTEEINNLAIKLSENLNAEIVNIIGKTIVLYRKNKKKQKTTLII